METALTFLLWVVGAGVAQIVLFGLLLFVMFCIALYRTR